MCGPVEGSRLRNQALLWILTRVYVQNMPDVAIRLLFVHAVLVLDAFPATAEPHETAPRGPGYARRGT